MVQPLGVHLPFNEPSKFCLALPFEGHLRDRDRFNAGSTSIVFENGDGAKPWSRLSNSNFELLVPKIIGFGRRLDSVPES